MEDANRESMEGVYLNRPLLMLDWLKLPHLNPHVLEGWFRGGEITGTKAVGDGLSLFD